MRAGPRPGEPRPAAGGAAGNRESQATFLLKLILARREVAEEVDASVVGLVSDGARRELLQHLITAGAEAAELEAGVPESVAELAEQLRAAAKQLPPYSVAEARTAARQVVARMREQRLREEARNEVQRVAERQRELGALSLHEAAYALAGAGGIGPDEEDAAPGVDVLKSHERGLALHAHTGKRGPIKNGPTASGEADG